MKTQWRLHKFALISGAGWVLDLLILAGLVSAGVTTFAANCLSAGTAVTVVFIVAQHRTFVHDGSFILRKFVAYAAFNVGAVFLASLAVAALTRWILETAGAPALARLVGAVSHGVPFPVLASLAAKIAITPVTLYANFLFMGWLLERRLSLR